MKYKVTLNGRTYEVEVEAGKAMLVDEYEAYAPAPAAAPAAADAGLLPVVESRPGHHRQGGHGAPPLPAVLRAKRAAPPGTEIAEHRIGLLTRRIFAWKRRDAGNHPLSRFAVLIIPW